MIVLALYGGKSANADYWRHVRHAMTKLGFQLCKADPNVWFRPSIKSDGTDYYQYVLIYTDDILAIMEEPERFLTFACVASRESVRISFTYAALNGLPVRAADI